MNIVKKLWWFFKLEKKEYIIAISSLILVSILNLIPPKVIGNVIDKVGYDTLTKNELILNIIAILLAAIMMYILRYIWRIKLFGTSERLGKLMRFKLYNHFTKMSPSFYQKYRTGDLMAHVTNDVNALNQTAGPGVMSAVDSTITIAVTLLMMFFTLSWKLTLVVLIPMAFIVVITNRIGKKIHTSFKNSQQAFSELNNNVQESITGIKVTKSFNYGNEEVTKFKETNNNTYNKNIITMKYDVLFDPVIIVFVGMCYMLSLLYGGYLISLGNLTIGGLVTFIAYLDMLLWPLLAMGYLFNLVQRGSASYDRIEKILFEKSDVENTDNALTDINNGELKYNISNFSYEETSVIKDVEFSIKKGQTLGIVGQTGSGKTTLLKLLLRERDIQEGYINLNNTNIKEYDIHKLRNLMGYVPQDQILFSTTIKENVKFADTSLSDEEVEEVTKLSGVYKDIMDMPEGFETVVGERGVSLSGGQKQRIAICRALIINPEILILDDSLSAVDAKTEDFILENLRRLREDKTTIITAHRLSAVVHADLIIVMQNGTIVEKGTHEELLANKGWYYDTYNKQQIENNLEEGEFNE
ncbi:ABC transporter ATP-binding protein [Gemelliphila palaticanis]|uniref:ATP-binding cassette domain-containing protein n=1 Tax=Gemelliphila palaticanis TaxID=81950 RepID=A0ABX2SZC9_9BACL|nr:ABC transporter transmembrane domain-containing protein [Gemella palaticanis]MBF0715710.1 ATP-binding cassette domain-containing protein [Gemella palaticanis]NYS47640.1 ATP-binding cassette domain-containing protein [Gemella palaticanis]